MLATIRRSMIPIIGVLLLAVGLGYAFWPHPVAVDLGYAERKAINVTIDDEGETRVKEDYFVSAPLPGRVHRFTGDVGDVVTAGKTPIATIEPTEPVFLDNRTRSELEAMVKVAEAAIAQSIAEHERLLALRDFAHTEYERAAALVESDTISASSLDRALMELRNQAAAAETALANRYAREFELERARAALLSPGERPATTADNCCFTVTSPVNGRILRILQESETIVAAGAPLVEIGDPEDLEIIADLLSTDAVQVTVGDQVIIANWGGEKALSGVVRLIEPFGFTKVSTLGIEEQRVNVIIDLTDSYEQWQRLGHGYRVDVGILVWQSEDVLTIPIGALFRHDGKWAVFAVTDGRARITLIEIGHMNNRYAEVLGGLEIGQAIVLHPSDRISENTRVVSRE